MQYEKISASDQYSVTLILSKRMAQFLESVIDENVYKSEQGETSLDIKKLKRIGDLLWQYNKPTPSQRYKSVDRWLRKLKSGCFDTDVSIGQEKRSKAQS